ncbi:hypothetical protein H8B13_12135 [Hymenobacter sp. BT188]|uniref:hypothetical protein n=1 Tax=Hymenobacter sp. BT188 TaxID=2763504 RepID=UPI0016517FC8|nr:hypothetical protein [Hymenobacter sp. BT188]MBC6607569.1 hypothetical protein [Hymenobacter sp. BT188]
MGKGKKKGSKKAKKLEKDMLDVAAESIRKYRRISNEIGKLSTTQKLFGGVGLLAAALTYLANKETIDRLASADGLLASLMLGKTRDNDSGQDALPPNSDQEPSKPVKTSKPVKRSVANKSQKRLPASAPHSRSST